VVVAAPAQAQTQTIYDDLMQNGWANYSYNGGFDFAATAFVHGGTKSISYVPDDVPNAVSLALPFAAGDVTTAQYPVLHFWIHAGPTGGQQLGISLGRSDTDEEIEAIVAFGSLTGYIAGGVVAANQWREVTVNLTQAPLSYNGSFDRIDIYTDNFDQPVLYMDDFTLTQAGAPPPVNALQVEHDVTVASMLSDRFTWRDSRNEPRVAVLAHNDTAASYSSRSCGPAANEAQ
jgi:hypothetical protein